MVFKRKRMFKRRFRRKTGLVKRVNAISKRLQGENMNVIVSGATTPNTTGTVTNICTVPQGDGSNNRTGNDIRVRSIFYRMGISANPSAGFSMIRIMIVLDTQQVANTSPTISQILDSVYPTSPLSLTTEGRFKIMKDYTLVLDGVTRKSVMLKKYIKCNIPMKFNGALSTNIQKNGLYLIQLSNESTTVPQTDWSFKCTYTDN